MYFNKKKKKRLVGEAAGAVRASLNSLTLNFSIDA